MNIIIIGIAVDTAYRNNINHRKNRDKLQPLGVPSIKQSNDQYVNAQDKH